MRLANETALKIGLAGTIFLRPTLRAARRLEFQYGFERILAGLVQGNLGIIADVVAECGTPTHSAFLDTIKDMPLGPFLSDTIQPLTDLVLALTGHDPDASNTHSNDSGEETTFAEFFAKLYRIGTGWLGWPPDQTWDATPAEILEASKGHVEMLRAIHGSPEPEQTSSGPDNSPLDRAGLQALKGLARVR